MKKTYFEHLKKPVLSILKYWRQDFLKYDKKILDNKELQNEIFILCVRSTGTNLITKEWSKEEKKNAIHCNSHFFLCQDDNISKINQDDALKFNFKKEENDLKRLFRIGRISLKEFYERSHELI